MEIHTQIRKYRTILNLSQEELAEKVYVTRQTISNWETNKNYPDIHSLLLLSSIFNLSLDQLVKGDVEIMKEEIHKNEIKKFDQDGRIFTVMLILLVVAVIPLCVCLDYYGLIISAIIYIITVCYATKIEKYKRRYNLQTYKDIVAFTEGQRLDEITIKQEDDKRPYLMIFFCLVIPIITFIIGILFVKLLKLFLFT